MTDLDFVDCDPRDLFDEIVGGMTARSDMTRADALAEIFAGRTAAEVCADYDLPADFFDGDDDVPV